MTLNDLSGLAIAFPSELDCYIIESYSSSSYYSGFHGLLVCLQATLCVHSLRFQTNMHTKNGKNFAFSIDNKYVTKMGGADKQISTLDCTLCAINLLTYLLTQS